jgi:hypothetical protein
LISTGYGVATKPAVEGAVYVPGPRKMRSAAGVMFAMASATSRVW